MRVTCVIKFEVHFYLFMGSEEQRRGAANCSLPTRNGNGKWQSKKSAGRYIIKHFRDINEYTITQAHTIAGIQKRVYTIQSINMYAVHTYDR